MVTSQTGKTIHPYWPLHTLLIKVFCRSLYYEERVENIGVLIYFDSRNHQQPRRGSLLGLLNTVVKAAFFTQFFLFRYS